MVDHEDASSTRSTSPTLREQEAEKKHVERMHSKENSVKRNEQQKREKEERYARRTRQRTTGKEEHRNASEPPAIGSHTTQPIHHRSQSEEGNDQIYKGDKDTNEDNVAQKGSEDKDDLILRTHLGTYVLRTKGTGKSTGTHTPVSGVRDKGKTYQGSATKEDFLNPKNWEKVKKKFEEQFTYKDSGFSGGSTQNQMHQEIKRPISQEEFDKKLK